MQFHPLAEIFPLVEGKAFDDLVDDIRTHGVREPVWLCDGLILDGRNRWRAAEVAKVVCPTRDYEGNDSAGFVVSLNLHRRHLTESQRAMVAAKLATLPRGANQHASIEAPSQVDAASMLNVGRASVQRARDVIDDGALVSSVERGDISVSLASQVVSLPADEKAAVAAAIDESPAHAKEIAREAVRAHVANNSGNNEWYTPPNYIEAAREAMGAIDMDPASCEVANRTVKAETYFDAKSDGLRQQWRGNVWMNPPYAQPLIADFCEALVEKYVGGEVDQACVLVNNGTETGWFQELLSQAAAVCFIKTRVRFLDPAGKPSGAPLQGQAVIYLGKTRERFADAFCSFGKVLYA